MLSAEATRLTEIAQRPGMEPAALYTIGSEAVWGATFYDIGPDTLEPALAILQRAATELPAGTPLSFLARNHLAYADVYRGWTAVRTATEEDIGEAHAKLAGILDDQTEVTIYGNYTVGGASGSIRREQVSRTIYQMLLTRRDDPDHLAIPNPNHAHTAPRWREPATGNFYPTSFVSVTTKDRQVIPAFLADLEGIDRIPQLKGYKMHFANVGSTLAGDIGRTMPGVMAAVRGEKARRRAEYALMKTAEILLDETAGEAIGHDWEVLLDNRGSQYIDRIERSGRAVAKR